MAEAFQGPVTINGELHCGNILPTNTSTGVVELVGGLNVHSGLIVSGNATYNSQLVNFSQNVNVFATLGCGAISPTNTTTGVVELTGGLNVHGGLIVSGNATYNSQLVNFNHDLNIFGGLTVQKNIDVAGDVRFTHAADCAEDFTIAGGLDVEPGTVVVLNPEGCVLPSKAAYDKRVVGVVSGAGDYRPGIVLDRKPDLRDRQPVALLGKVFCKVDADHAPIAVGDLLTTAPTEGHAMKAIDPAQAFGAVIGKALQSLPSGRGMIAIIVALQ